MLTEVHYDAIDNSSSARLCGELAIASAEGKENAILFTRGGLRVLVPVWAIVCALAEREDEESELRHG